MKNNYNVLLQTLKGHSSYVYAVAFFPDGTLLVLASGDKTVKLQDAWLGAALQTLEGYLSHVDAVAFLPDRTLVASASGDRTIKLWDARSGAALVTL